MTEEELQEIADTYGLYTEQDVKNRVSCELLSIGTRNEELETENVELKDKLKNLESVAEVRLANWQKYEKGLKEAKDLIRNLLRVTYGEGWNYSLDVKVKAEDFLKEDINEQART